MAYRKTEWSRLVDEQPEHARTRILTAFLATKGNTTQAAKHLGISHRSLCRYMAQLELKEVVKKLRLEFL